MKRFFSRIVDVKPDEPRALWLGFVFHFLILTGYYILRPIRDSIAASNRLETLPWMFTATLVGMLIANAVFAAIVARMSRRKFIPIAYAFFIFNLALFFFLMRSSPPAQQVWIGRALYVWVSVFNLFNTAIFWAFMTDLFTVEQGKRLYGFIAVGGSLGGVLGAYITTHFVRDIGPANLLAISMVRYTTTSAWAYFQQSDLAREALKDSNARTVFLGNLDMWVNSITVIIQLFLTGRLLKWFGVGFTLVAMPFLSMVGFAAMGIAPSLGLLAAFQVVRRAAAYVLMRPSREILFTVLRREDKYKVKSVTDTLGYRVGDQLGAWSYGGLHAVGLGLASISFVAVPVVAGWCVLSLWLARAQRALADAQRRKVAPFPETSQPEPA